MEVTVNLLNRVLNQRQLSVAWLARRSGRAHATITNLIDGADPRLSTMVDIARALGVNVQDIWPGLKDVT